MTGLGSLRLAITFVFLLYVTASIGAETAQGKAGIDPTKIQSAVKMADVVFVGRISTMGPMPAYESGRIIAYREVEYELLELLKGDVDTEIVTVRHLGGPSSEFLKILREDEELIVFAQLQQGDYWASGSRKGALSLTPKTLALVKDAVD